MLPGDSAAENKWFMIVMMEHQQDYNDAIRKQPI